MEKNCWTWELEDFGDFENNIYKMVGTKHTAVG